MYLQSWIANVPLVWLHLVRQRVGLVWYPLTLYQQILLRWWHLDVSPDPSLYGDCIYMLHYLRRAFIVLIGMRLILSASIPMYYVFLCYKSSHITSICSSFSDFTPFRSHIFCINMDSPFRYLQTFNTTLTLHVPTPCAHRNRNSTLWWCWRLSCLHGLGGHHLALFQGTEL